MFRFRPHLSFNWKTTCSMLIGVVLTSCYLSSYFTCMLYLNAYAVVIAFKCKLLRTMLPSVREREREISFVTVYFLLLVPGIGCVI